MRSYAGRVGALGLMIRRSWVDEAEILAHLGDTRHAADDLPQVRDLAAGAPPVPDDLHHPAAEQVCAKLASAEASPDGNPPVRRLPPNQGAGANGEAIVRSVE